MPTAGYFDNQRHVQKAVAGPWYDYEVQKTVYNDPNHLYDPDPDIRPNWLADKKYFAIGAGFGIGLHLFTNVCMRRPLYAGVPLYFVYGLFGGVTHHYLRKYVGNYVTDRDQMLRHYVQLHPEDFPAPERRKMNELFQTWLPHR